MISSILIAAGQSKRMNGENKLTKKINGTPLINHSVKNILSRSIDELIIVLGFQKEILKKIIDNHPKIKFVFNEDFESGMASSIKTGLNHLSNNTESFFICLADMPMVNFKTYNFLSSYSKKKDIIVPTYNGVQGNPVLFSKSMKSNIMTISGDIGAKKILELNEDKILKIKIEDTNIKRDFNTKDDFNFNF